jgi:large subunit ribosomal protein L1
MAKHGKNYRKAAELFQDGLLYSPLQAAGLAK